MTLTSHTTIAQLGRVCRLGLATRGNTRLNAEAVEGAVARGVDYLNWCGHPDGMRDAVRRMGPKRSNVRIAVQLGARDAQAARAELHEFLGELHTDYLDVVTYYYVEHPDEWAEILAPGGAAEALESARAAGQVRAIGLTSHQRPLAAQAAASGRLDVLMIRYNAAHRGAEHDVFPVTDERGISVVAFTCLRWGDLLKATPEDPPGFRPPSAADCYRFVLGRESVSVALAAPDGERELAETLTILDGWCGLSRQDEENLKRHGARVHRHAREFW